MRSTPEDRAFSALSAPAIKSFSIFHPNASSPISDEWNSTGRGGNNAPVSSIRRRARIGAARAASGAQRSSDSRKATERSSKATVRPRPARSSAPQQTTSKPARAKPRAAASPARPAPAIRTSQPRGARMSRSIIFGLSPALPQAALAHLGSRETASRNFDKAEAARSSRSRRVRRCRRMKAGRAGHVDREAAPSRRAGGGILRTRFYRLRRRGGGAGALRGDRAQFLGVLRLARLGPVHRWNRWHAGARRAGAGTRAARASVPSIPSMNRAKPSQAKHAEKLRSIAA